MAVKQLSVFVENKPGRLKDVADIISKEDVNIRAMSIADTKDFGILRLIVSDLEKAKNALKDDYVVSAIDVIAVEMNDKAGSLANVLNVFDKAGINIDYLYAFTAPTKEGAYVVLRVNDTEAAENVLKDNGIPTLADEDVRNF